MATLVAGPRPGAAALAVALLGAVWLEPSAMEMGPPLAMLAVSGAILVTLGGFLRRLLVRLMTSEERLRLAVRSTGLGTWDFDGVSGKRRWSRRFRAIIGVGNDVPPEPAAFAALIHPDDRDWVNDRYREAHAPQGDGWYDAEFRIRRADTGEERWVAATGRMFFDVRGHLTRAAGAIVDVTKRRAVENALRESEERYRTLLETAPDAIHVHRDGVIILANQRAVTLFGGRTQEDIVGRAAMSLVDAASLELARVRTARLSSPGQRNPPVELILRRLDGTSVPVEAASAVVHLDGRPAILAVLRDVSERKTAEAQRELLMREVDHRARNALTIVLSLVRLTRASGQREFVAAVEGRVAALARTHSLLASNRWRYADLEAVVSDELASLGGERGVSIGGPAVSLRPEAVQPMAMLLHELATNAVKYGALSVADGRLAISWQQDANGSLRFHWDESGGPRIPSPPLETGFGTTLIESAVRDQLYGHIDRQWRECGLRCEIAIGREGLS
ncbi:MAG: PAS domain S-box protein [Geminicoccaceae bacterium]